MLCLEVKSKNISDSEVDKTTTTVKKDVQRKEAHEGPDIEVYVRAPMWNRDYTQDRRASKAETV